ncbi:MAG: hypothetical protein OXE50_16175 [Chloroflexi bacterium]|nr:hypothetical protein [Chloroflexota bacterium]
MSSMTQVNRRIKPVEGYDGLYVRMPKFSENAEIAEKSKTFNKPLDKLNREQEKLEKNVQRTERRIDIKGEEAGQATEPDSIAALEAEIEAFYHLVDKDLTRIEEIEAEKEKLNPIIMKHTKWVFAKFAVDADGNPFEDADDVDLDNDMFNAVMGTINPEKKGNRS